MHRCSGLTSVTRRIAAAAMPRTDVIATPMRVALSALRI
jgi:hypothetical protein